MKLLGHTILAGESKTIEVEIAKLQTMTNLKLPVIIERSKIEGPVVLFTAGIHGDEINGTDIVRKLITSKTNKPFCGTIICIPVVNIFGFINQKREFPDKRDLNRVFPGSKNGSLASRFAHFLVTEIIPKVDYVIDFHAGGASRFNAPQIRIIQHNLELKQLATVFNAPFTVYSNNIAGSFRSSCLKSGVKILLFEGGKSLDINQEVTSEAVVGVKRFLRHLGMLSPRISVPPKDKTTVFIEKSGWIRANYSGMMYSLVKVGSFVNKGMVMAIISDPYGKKEYKLKATNNGYIINVNDASIVYQGDAIFHISTHIENE